MDFNSANIAITIAAQLPVVVLFAVIVFKMQDRFDKAQERRDSQFLASQEKRDGQFIGILEKVTARMDDLHNAIKIHDAHVDDRVQKIRRRQA